MAKLSPFAPARFPSLPPVPGVRLATAAAQVRYKGRDDVLLAELAEGTTAAGVLTRSKAPGAPSPPALTRLALGPLASGHPSASGTPHSGSLLGSPGNSARDVYAACASFEGASAGLRRG